MGCQSTCGRQCIKTARTDCRDVTVGLNDFAVARKQEDCIFVRNQKQCLKPPQNFISAPIFGKRDCRPLKMPVRGFKFLLEFFKQREGIGDRAREARDNFVVIESANFFGG